MKKFTFIALLLAIFSTVAKADLTDKYFFKVSTEKMDANWVIQDASNFASTPGKEYLEVQNKKNGGRMLNYFWNENAWSKMDINNLPNHTYKYTMDLNMSNMAARADLEFVLLPVNACTAADARVSTHNYHWWNASEGEDFFFRFSVSVPSVANGDFKLYFNETPTARNDFGHQTATDSLEVKSQTKYKFSVVVNADEKTATYTVANEDGETLATGVHKYVCEEDRAGIFVFGMNGTSTHQLSNIGLSYEAEGPFANDPSVELFALMGTNRYYYATFAEGETLHWKQLGDVDQDIVTMDSYTDGEEYQVEYESADEKTSFEAGEGEYLGHKIIYCSKPGDLVMWTTRSDDETNRSEDVVVPVTCEEVSMPKPEATITNVSEGYAKEYTITADNSNTLLTPTVTIYYKIKNSAGDVIAEKDDAMSGEVVKLTEPGSLELYAYDGTHPAAWYSPSETVEVKNNTEYVVAELKDYAWSKDICDGTVAGFTKTEIVDAGNKSHWDRIYSTQMYGYDENGNSTACTDADAANYVSTKKGFGFYEMAAIGTTDAKWNVQTPTDATTAFAPLTPTADFLANSKYDATAWGIFPLEGIVYYNTALTYAVLQLDPKYTSDDAEKPNFYIVHTRGGYDRPDKGDCNATTVCVAGEDFNLFRYDTAICDVRVMTYKGFTPTTGISYVNANETTTPSIKKVMTKNGLVIVKDNKTYSVAGTQIK